ncbi:MAG: carboxymuconolactone decarboxylase family protein [Capsulimonadales bacterium]|nr:carboxymuconolactone decarboxylase family protein [Capsulimonadales bacterium]
MKFPALSVLALVSLTLVPLPSSASVDVTRFPLAPLDTPALAIPGGDALDSPTSGRVPGYLRVLAATHPKSVAPFARLFKTVVYGGTIAPETKAAMGLYVARSAGSRYLAAHLSRLLDRTATGRSLRAAVETGKTPTDAGQRIALAYAARLTYDIHGVDDARFAEARTVYNDARLVELTIATCFFHYFARFCQGAGLTTEEWLHLPPDAVPAPKPPALSNVARVSLASDDEMKMAAGLVNPSPDLKKGLGIGIANSQRAMLRVPDMASAWWDYWKSIRENATVPREMQLQVSFAVSMANGCRYCVLHQVAGLRRLNVDIAKLQAMKKDDSVLTPTEKAAVTFARKLARSPQSVNDTDVAGLKSAFPDDRAALEIVLQTCAFSFMNRFTDGLRLPSEEEAVEIYRETYGDGAYEAFPMS